MKKLFIENRKRQKISVIVEKSENQNGLAFVMHGLGGFKEQTHINTFAASFRDAGFTVIRFDTTNTLGESDGNYERATTTNYYKDLEDVVSWASKQEWYQEPFFLAAHSLGGICIALYAENFPAKVKGLAPISTVVSGKMVLEKPSLTRNNKLKEWKDSGWKEAMSISKPGVIKRLPWSHMEDRMKYDLLENVDKLTMPVLLIVGEEDDTTPVEQQKVLFDALPGEKEIHIIQGASHTFRDENHLKQIKEMFDNWIRKIK